MKPKSSRALGPGAIISIVLHTALIFVLLNLVHPSLLIQPKPKNLATVVLQPPPPPPPPPPPKKPPPPPPKEPPKPVRTPPPPQQIITQAPVTPEPVPTVAPPPPPAPPAPPQEAPRVVGTSVPAAYYNSLMSIIASNMRYPPSAIRANQEGACKVRVTFTRDGSIEHAEVVEKAGFLALDAECHNVFERIKFPPMAANSEPDKTDFSIELPINFTLSETQ